MHPHSHKHHHPFHGPSHLPSWQRRRRLLLPFALAFGGLILLFSGGLGAAIYLVLTRQAEAPGGGWLLLLCGIPLAFLLSASLLGSLTFRRFGRPLEDIFTAIDSIAEGDLSVRVSERYPREFGRLARRFNHMIAELERAETQRRNLTADIAHELRNPLHIIQGNLEGMLDGVYEPTPENLNNTLDETRLLARLVNDLQTLSLAEAGQLPLHPGDFALADLMNDLHASFAARAAAQGVALKTELVNPQREMHADYDRLNQVLSNLIANALQHTPPGGVITLAGGDIPPGEEAGGGVRLRVSDSGKGIAAEDLPFIFDRFWRGDRSRTDRSSSGLGLAIARQWVQAHHGTIAVESAPGVGTEFVIDLPQEAARP